MPLRIVHQRGRNARVGALMGMYPPATRSCTFWLANWWQVYTGTVICAVVRVHAMPPVLIALVQSSDDVQAGLL
jgi:hypothetical protein